MQVVMDLHRFVGVDEGLQSVRGVGEGGQLVRAGRGRRGSWGRGLGTGGLGGKRGGSRCERDGLEGGAAVDHMNPGTMEEDSAASMNDPSRCPPARLGAGLPRFRGSWGPRGVPFCAAIWRVISKAR